MLSWTPSTVQAGQVTVFEVAATADAPDDIPGDGLCSSAIAGGCTLRAALMEAEQLGPEVVSIEIRIPPGTYALTRNESAQPNDSASGDLDVRTNGARLALKGWVGEGQIPEAPQRPVITAGPDFPRRLLRVAMLPSTQEIAFFDLVFAHAHATSWSAAAQSGTQFPPDNGAAIQCNSQHGKLLRLDRVAMDSNTTAGVGAALHSAGCSLDLTEVEVAGNCGLGAAVKASGTVGSVAPRRIDVRDSSFTSNSPVCLDAPAAQFVALSVDSSTDNESWDAIVENTTISHNTGSMTFDVPATAASPSTVLLRHLTLHQNQPSYLGYEGVQAFGNLTIAIDHAFLGESDGFAALGATITSSGYSRASFVTQAGAGFVPHPNDLSLDGPAKLGPLVRISPWTLGHAPLADSPLVDAGDSSANLDEETGCLGLDQAGSVRPSGARCDIGAIEYQPPVFVDGFEGQAEP